MELLKLYMIAYQLMGAWDSQFLSLFRSTGFQMRANTAQMIATLQFLKTTKLIS
jgi:hypothetical protein